MNSYTDTYQHKGLRKQLVASLREKGIEQTAVLDAILAVPRHFFLDSAFDKIAYEDRAFPIAAQQTISQPFMVAYQTQLLDIQKNDMVLEIGTGSMYQAIILARLGARVFTIERQKILFDLQKNNPLKKQYPNIKFFFGDGFKGLPTYAPFDKIIVTAAAPYLPEALVKQLKPDGKMVIPIEENGIQRIKRITKNRDGAITEENYDACSFVPMLVGKN